MSDPQDIEELIRLFETFSIWVTVPGKIQLTRKERELVIEALKARASVCGEVTRKEKT